MKKLIKKLTLIALGVAGLATTFQTDLSAYGLRGCCNSCENVYYPGNYYYPRYSSSYYPRYYYRSSYSYYPYAYSRPWFGFGLYW